MKFIGLEKALNLIVTYGLVDFAYKDNILYYNKKILMPNTFDFQNIIIEKFGIALCRVSDYQHLYDNILIILKRSQTELSHEYELLPESAWHQPTVEYIKSQNCWKTWLSILKYMYFSKDNSWKIFFAIQGPSGTGKTTYINNTMCKLIKDWKQVTNGFAWLDDSLDCQVAWLDELSNDDYINNKTIDIIKRLTGNANKMSLNIKGKSIKEVKNKTKLLMTFNEPSKIAQSEAPYFFDRMFYIYFKGPKYKIDPNFKPDIDVNTLYSMVCNADDKLLIDQTSSEMKQAWMDHCDSIKMYKLEWKSNNFIYLDYKDWCIRNHYRPIAEMEAKKRWKDC